MTCFNPQLKLLHQPERLAAFIGGDWLAPPALVEISPTNACNAKCPFCFYVGTHSKEHIQPETLGELLRDLAGMLVPAISWTGGGDPSVYPHLTQAMEHAAWLGLRQGMFTNGYKLIDRPELLQWVRLTITDRETLPPQTAAYARATKTGVVHNLTPENGNNLRLHCEQARDAGAAYFQVRPALASTLAEQQPVRVPDELLELQTGTFRVILTPYKWDDYQRPHGYPRCHGHRFAPFVWYNGDVAVCAYHFGREDYTFGNLREKPFREIWKSERRRRMVASGPAVIPACQHCCKNHEVNKALAALAGDGAPPEDGAFL